MKDNPPILKSQAIWENLYFYQKAKSLYVITFHFAHTYLSKGDRTIDQIIQAARSGKQNIVEGSADGVHSLEMEMKLLNVARASIKELCEDYEDYLMVRHLPLWNRSHPRFNRLLAFCRHRNKPEEFEALLGSLSEEEEANLAVTLCHFTDKMMLSYQKKLVQEFLEVGGIRERMTAARMKERNRQRQDGIRYI